MTPQNTLDLCRDRACHDSAGPSECIEVTTAEDQGLFADYLARRKAEGEQAAEPSTRFGQQMEQPVDAESPTFADYQREYAQFKEYLAWRNKQ